MADEITWVFRLEGEGGGEAPAAGTPGAEGAPAPVRQNPRTTARENAERAEGGAPEVIRKRQAGRAVDTSGRDAAKQAKRLAEGEAGAARQAAIGIANRGGLGGVVGKGLEVAAGLAGPVGLAVAAAAGGIAVAGKANALIQNQTNELAPFSADILGQRAQNEVAEIQRKLRSAQRRGAELAEFEAIRGQFGRAAGETKDIAASLLAKAVTALDRGLEALGPLAFGVSGLRELQVARTWAEYFGGERDQEGKIGGQTILQRFEDRPFLEPAIDAAPGTFFRQGGRPADAQPVGDAPAGALQFNDFD